MSRDAKRNNKFNFCCCVFLVGHWINSYLLVAPGTLDAHGHIGLVKLEWG